MPYNSNASLPSSVKGNLPEHAQSIYRETFNSAVTEYHSEATAARVAWSAVSKSYKKRGGKWVKR